MRNFKARGVRQGKYRRFAEEGKIRAAATKNSAMILLAILNLREIPNTLEAL